MTPTLTLKTEELIQALTVRASQHREKAAKHAADEMGAFYAHLAEQCELEARQLEAKQLLETVQQDPFSQAMAECGAMELRGGQLRTSRSQASRQLLGSPTQAPAQARRWPF
jgi:hypothetical protein